MQDPPPRRTRRKPTGGASTPLPLVPILIGVIVLGFVIGAGLSFFGKGQPAIVSVADSPSAAATIAPPSALPETPPPLPSPSPRPATPQPRPSPLPSRTQHPAPAHPVTPPANASAAAAATTAPVVANAATGASDAATATPDTSAAAGASAAAAPGATVHSADSSETPRAAAVSPGGQNAAPVSPAATSAGSQQGPVVVSGSTTPFARLAASVVRVYLSAVARGDYDSAAAELASPPAGALVEESVVDGATQVRAVEVHGTGDIVTVNVDLKTSAGPYSAQFTVQKSSTGAALIADHSITKS